MDHNILAVLRVMGAIKVGRWTDGSDPHIILPCKGTALLKLCVPQLLTPSISSYPYVAVFLHNEEVMLASAVVRGDGAATTLQKLKDRGQADLGWCDEVSW